MPKAPMSISLSLTFSPERYNKIVSDTFLEIDRLAKLKGGEYSGDHDRLANFRRNAEAAETTMELIWRIYAAKHWDALMQYEKDIRQGRTRQRTESIEGRIDDMIVYLLLFKCMVEERREVSDTFPPRPEETDQ